jgi:hypothetical protein
MLLSSLSIALLACLFGYKQSRELKRAQDSLNKQGLELGLLNSQYRHNLKALSQALKDKDALTSDIAGLLKEIQGLNSQVKELKIDIECSQQFQINEDTFQEVIEAHVLNVLSSIDLQDAYERACDSYDLEINMNDIVK